MKILVIHNYYGSSSPSGENIVVDEEIRLLKKFGNEVFVYKKSSDLIRKFKFLGSIFGGLVTPWNFIEYFKIKKVVKLFLPDVIHIHNTFPLISPSILYSIPNSVPVVMTLHNYRLFCAAGIPMRDSRVCTLCIDKNSVLPSIRFRCYRDSFFATIPIALNIFIHKKFRTWNKKITKFIVLSDFHKYKFNEAGLDLNKIVIKSNFFSGRPIYVPFNKRIYDVIFVGRISVEKGIMTLLKAWKDMGINSPNLLIVGDGFLFQKVQEYISINQLTNVFLKGKVTKEEANSLISISKLLILPSECYEGFPLVIAESFAFGTPVAVSNLGSLKEIVEDGKEGVVFDVGDFNSISNVVSCLFNNPQLMAQMSFNSRKKYFNKFTEEINYNELIRIYKNNMLI
uniref:glycosyltransferase family 4 protein n=1 Tax=Algoriphagus sp. TaxID=1872435 RepID=UPI004048248D